MGDNLGGALMRVRPEDDPEFDAADLEKLYRFRDRLKEWRRRREYVSFDRLLLHAMDEFGYAADLGSRAAANIDKFLAQVRAAAPRTSLDAFVKDLEMLRESNFAEQDSAPEDSADAVQVMTVHSAKGLEFPIVFVAAMHKGVESNPPVVAFSPRIGLGAQWRNPAIRKDKDDLFQHAIREERKDRDTKEADRLLYVAIDVYKRQPPSPPSDTKYQTNPFFAPTPTQHSHLLCPKRTRIGRPCGHSPFSRAVGHWHS